MLSAQLGAASLYPSHSKVPEGDMRVGTTSQGHTAQHQKQLWGHSSAHVAPGILGELRRTGVLPEKRELSAATALLRILPSKMRACLLVPVLIRGLGKASQRCHLCP